MLTQKEAQHICREALKRFGNTPAEAILMAEDDALTRFANNTIHQNVAERNLNLILHAYVGTRGGMATTNRTDAAALDDVVARACQNAKTSPEDPDFPGLAEPAQYPQVQAYDQPTEGYTPEQRAREISLVCQLAKENGVNAFGAFSTGVGEIAIANTQGLFAYHVASQADFQTVIMSDDSSGYAHATAWRVDEIDVENLARQAIDKADRSRNPRDCKPGEYAVVFDPYVTQDLLEMLAFHGMGARTVMEGRSWMNDRIGKQVMNPQVTIWDDGLDAGGLPVPFDFEGVPKQRVEIVTKGKVIGPVHNRSTALKAATTSTGHALPPAFYVYDPLPINLFMAPGDSSLDEMIRTTDRGLYISRFWYTRLVHPRDAVITGMTRDGVFMIEHGELTRPLKNLRFTQSYIQVLADVEAVSRETRLMVSEYGNLATRVPALKISRFNFTGVTV